LRLRMWSFEAASWLLLWKKVKIGGSSNSSSNSSSNRKSNRNSSRYAKQEMFWGKWWSKNKQEELLVTRG